MRDTKILVTGGAGMIGSNLVRRLSSLGSEVIVIDNLSRGKLDNLRASDGKLVINTSNFHNIDLSKNLIPEEIIKNVDYVYHLADVVAGIGYVFNNQSLVFRKNLLINSNTIESVKNTEIKGFIYVGTACSFPAHLQTGADSPPLKEDDQYPAAPESSYGWSKLMGEYETLLLEKEFDIPVSILSLHNVYGSPADYSNLTGQVIPTIIRKVIEAQNDITVWGSGSQGRAFVHVDDVVDALILALKKGLGHGMIQIGPDYCTSISDLTQKIINISNKKLNLKFDLTKPEGDRGRRADFTKAKKILGWSPKTCLDDGLTDLFNWILNDLKND